jgi:hypothetical protein
MSQTPSIDLNALWKYVTDKVKGQVTQPGLWRAMEAAKPVTLEDDQLVLGFAPQDSFQGGLLQDQRHKNVIEHVLEQATRKRLLIHVMAGETIEEWEAYKATQVEGQKLQKQARQTFIEEAERGENWDAVAEQLIRKFSNLRNRGLASVQGKYLEEAVTTLAEAYGRMMPEDPDEHTEREYSRALERVAERVNVPASVVAQQVLVRSRS